MAAEQPDGVLILSLLRCRGQEARRPGDVCRLLPAMDLRAAATRCTICLFGVHTVATVMASLHYTSLHRDLDVVELWSGVGSTVKAAEAYGLSAAAFDKDRRPGLTNKAGPGCEDITTETGFRNAVTLVMRIREGGLAGMAPTCSSFGFGPSSTTLRKSDNFAGDDNSEFVQKGNLQAQIAAFLFCLALARNVHAWFENPAGSLMFLFLRSVWQLFLPPDQHHLLSRSDGAAWLRKTILTVGYGERCAYITHSDKAKGETWLKRFKFVADGPWLQKAMRRCKCVGGRHEPLMDPVLSDPSKRTGRLLEMKKSQAYPAALGKALVDAWLGKARQPGGLEKLRPGDKANEEARDRKGRRLEACEPDDVLSDPWEGLEKLRPGDKANEKARDREGRRLEGNEPDDALSDPWEDAGAGGTQAKAKRPRQRAARKTPQRNKAEGQWKQAANRDGSGDSDGDIDPWASTTKDSCQADKARV